ncbi:putative enzyme related to lactoylglutathione lyase [Kribbella amoyensis]|uniref:Putative enzyme related to lactoylglutathione lyase n=1 Tax=Kribbella amoyensis TaxID=996641 RepID=A0A561BNI8_9ACTN|nr:VOC family protein [Kribbella amoyensis]TWD80417.1 putative enzyme related to lactoylglutathione lyase [Kribbella amoyensis]
MTSLVRTVTFDARDPYQLAGFWLQVFGVERPDDDHPGEPYAAVPTPTVKLLFEQNDDARVVKNRVHLDLEPDIPRDQEIERLLALGATLAEDRREPDGKGWAVLRDPEGNEFCVLRSLPERATNP